MSIIPHRISITILLIPCLLGSCAEKVQKPIATANVAEAQAEPSEEPIVVAAEPVAQEPVKKHLAELCEKLEVGEPGDASMSELVLAARIAAASGNNEQAIRSYALALSCAEASNDNPLTGRALLELSRVLVEEGHLGAAIETYERVARIVSETDAAELGDGPLKSLSRSPGRVWGSIAKIQGKMGDLESAIETYEKARELSADDGQVQLFCARGLAQIGEFERALAIIDELTQDDSARGAAAELLVVIRDMQGEPGKAEDDLKALASEYPEDGRVAIVLAEYYVKNEKSEKARKILAEQVKENPYLVASYQKLAELEIRDGQPGRAIEWLAKMVHANRASIVEARWRILQMAADKENAAELLSELEKIKGLRRDFALCWAAGTVAEVAEQSAGAHSYYRRAIALQRRFGRLYLYLIRSYLREGQADTALAIIAAAQKSELGSHSDFYRAEGLAYIMKDDMTAAVASLEAAVGADPNDSAAREILSGTLMTIGRVDEAAMHLEILTSEEPGDKTLVRQLIAAHLADGRADRAAAAGEKFMAGHLLDEQTRLAVAEAFTKAKMFGEALEVLQGCPTNKGQLVRWRELYVQCLAQTNQTERAKQELADWRATADSQKKRVQLTARMAGVFGAAGKLDTAVELATKELEADPDNPAMQELLVYLLIEQKEYEKADELVSGWMAENPGRDRRMLAVSVMLAREDYDEAEGELDSLISKNDKDVQARHMLASVYELTGRTELAGAQYEKILEISPQDIWANNNQGYYLAENNKNLDEAERMIRSALRWAGPESAVVDSMGWVCYKKGRFGQAMAYVSRALRLAEESNGEGLDHLGDIYYRLGEADQAVGAWQKALAAEQGGDGVDGELAKRLQNKLKMIESGEGPPVAWSIVDDQAEVQSTEN